MKLDEYRTIIKKMKIHLSKNIIKEDELKEYYPDLDIEDFFNTAKHCGDLFVQGECPSCGSCNNGLTQGIHGFEKSEMTCDDCGTKTLGMAITSNKKKKYIDNISIFP